MRGFFDKDRGVALDIDPVWRSQRRLQLDVVGFRYTSSNTLILMNEFLVRPSN